MRKFLPIIALFTLAATCHASHTIIQQNQCIGPRGSGAQQYLVSCPFTNPNAAGDGILVIAFGTGIQYPSCAPQVPGDTNSNSYSSVGQALDGSNTKQITMWVAFSVAAGANTVKFQCNSFDYISVFIYEIQGTLGQTNVIDQINTGTCSSCVTNNLSTGNITTTLANEIIFSAIFVNATATTFVSSFTDGVGWVNPVRNNDPINNTCCFVSTHGADMIVTSTGTYANAFSWSGGPASPTAVAFIASFSFGPPVSAGIVHRRQVY